MANSHKRRNTIDRIRIGGEWLEGEGEGKGRLEQALRMPSKGCCPIQLCGELVPRAWIFPG